MYRDFDIKVLLWNQVKSRIEACYSELILVMSKITKNGRTLSKDAYNV